MPSTLKRASCPSQLSPSSWAKAPHGANVSGRAVFVVIEKVGGVGDLGDVGNFGDVGDVGMIMAVSATIGEAARDSELSTACNKES
jgi:hypothetical protein